MELGSAVVLLTGGTGNIGRAVARELLGAGAAVLITDRNALAVDAIIQSVSAHQERVAGLTADIAQPAGRAVICREAQRWRGGINVLVNTAGVNPFRLFDDHMAVEEVDTAFAVSVQAPIRLCRSLLPYLRRRERAVIVNIGWESGGAGCPGYLTCTAAKFAIRGFTEALRRELAGTTISVHHLAPRTTRPIASCAVGSGSAGHGAAMDPSERAARAVRVMLEREPPHAEVGRAGKIFDGLKTVLSCAVASRPALHGQRRREALSALVTEVRAKPG